MIAKGLEEYSLWQDFKKNSSQEAFHQLVIKYLPLVKYHAGRVKMMVPVFIEQDDLESYGVIGLIDAIHKFDIEQGVKFKTYASRRIRGEIIDHLRKLDWLPHSIRREGKRVKKAADKLAKQLERKPTIEELAETTDLSVSKIESLYQKIYSSQWISIYDEFGHSQVLDMLPQSDRKSPEKVFQGKEREETLAEAIDRLQENERLVISLFYHEGLTQKEIAGVMDLSAARISQIHKKAIYRLRGMLSKKKKQLV
ncbi:MAG: sigma-70 family RNA polymerase sigma factor [Halanaerobiaceae bacterium]